MLSSTIILDLSVQPWKYYGRGSPPFQLSVQPWKHYGRGSQPFQLSAEPWKGYAEDGFV